MTRDHWRTASKVVVSYGCAQVTPKLPICSNAIFMHACRNHVLNVANKYAGIVDSGRYAVTVAAANVQQTRTSG